MKRSGMLARVTSSQSSTPGPGAYTPGFAAKAKAPAYTLKGRHESSQQITDAPYRDLPSSIGAGPKISLASRHAQRASDSSPGPSYIPPPLGSDAKKSSFSFRHPDSRDLSSDNPGPGAYSLEPLFAKDAKKFTLHGRTGDSFQISSQSPGPAAYNPDYLATRTRPPSSTFHVRTAIQQTSDITPGPGAYAISRDLGGRTATFHTRSSYTSTSSATPGPGAYNPSLASTMKNTPSYTMKSRHDPPSSSINTAPYHNIPSTIGVGPRISLGSRREVRTTQETPGPSYVPPSFGSDAKKLTFGGGRYLQSRSGDSDTPGPGAYMVPSTFGREGIRSSMHSRHAEPNTANASPGPGAYYPDYNFTKPRAPSASMHIRTRMNQPESTPGYYDIGSTLTVPKFTIGRRENLGVIPI